MTDWDGRERLRHQPLVRGVVVEAPHALRARHGVEIVEVEAARHARGGHWRDGSALRSRGHSRHDRGERRSVGAEKARPAQEGVS